MANANRQFKLHLGGAVKDIHQWRKYWRDQKLHAKEREALIKSSFQRSGINGVKKMKQLSAFEERIVALLVLASISGSDVPKLLTVPQGPDMRMIDSPSQPALSVSAAEDAVALAGIVEASEDITSIADAIPVTVVAWPSSAMPTARKRKKAPSGKPRNLSSIEEKILKIEDEKLSFIKKTYELQERSFNWQKEYEEKLLALREREVSAQEKEFKLKMKNSQ